jgi:Raf kinase inhibitor-like YbhB/YbcL family protein
MHIGTKILLIGITVWGLSGCNTVSTHNTEEENPTQTHNPTENNTTDQRQIPIVIIGPSTVYISHELNEAIHPDGRDCRLEGWGERLYHYAKDPDAIYNFARPGSSSTDFPEPPEGKDADVQTLYGPNRDHYWAKVVEKMGELDSGILLIQYGANEPSTTTEEDFKGNIQTYINKAKELHFTPILITEIAKRIREDDGTLKQVRGNYPRWMKEVARNNQLEVLDLNAKSREKYARYTDAEWEERFTDCSNRWNHKKETTHYEAKGAREVASWIRDLACQTPSSRLCQQFTATPKTFNFTSSDFIPEHGAPHFAWDHPPKGTKSYVLIVDDADAKDGSNDWVHWSVINIDPSARSLSADALPEGSTVAINSNGQHGYADPAYPETHRYVAHLYALDTADVTNATYFHGAKIFDPERTYDHEEFEKVFSLFILEKREISSR